jgi:hypothetical protein
MAPRVRDEASSPETSMRIRLHQIQEFLDGANGRGGGIGVPFEVRPHPEHFPYASRPYKGRFGHGVLHNLVWSLPRWANLKYLDALPVNTEADVELRPDVRRRSSFLDVASYDSLDPLCFNFVEGHVQST